MNKRLVIAAVMLATMAWPTLSAQQMNKMWSTGDQTAKLSKEQNMFEWGNYAMFIHWGLYSQLANVWNGKTYYGIGEWMMNKAMANIPVDDYMALANNFNPTAFNADSIATVAKQAGMKYIVVTAKHHDGFAMFDSKACDFNIVKATSFGRDPMKELSEACRRHGLGFGFYYSHNQDWTYPGGNRGPKFDSQGNPKTFDDYFYEKCLPQVEELTTNYGDVVLIWFDTPGGMDRKYAQLLVETVHRNQPNALVSGRVGYDLGDYNTLGDMEVPQSNIEGMWESIDVTNDSWGYAWYDNNWKTPEQIVRTLVSTIARGGTFMLNVGPDGNGTIPVQAALSLKSAGRWVEANPKVVYGAERSPWNHALAWGDAVVNDGKIYLIVYQRPDKGLLWVPNLHNTVKAAKMNGKRLKTEQHDSGVMINLPYDSEQELFGVVELTVEGTPKADATLVVDANVANSLSVEYAKIDSCKAERKYWMEKFGEWKNSFFAYSFVPQTSSVEWEFDVCESGWYQISLSYRGDGRMVWSVENDEGSKIQNQQNSSNIVGSHSIGWMKFKEAGRHTLTVRFVEGNTESAELSSVQINRVRL